MNKEELEHKLEVEERIRTIKSCSDKRYAIKLVEHIVFGMLTLIFTGFALAIIRDYIK